DQWQYAVNLKERKEEVIRLIDEQGKLTSELKKQIKEATQLQQVEDLYRPYKQKRRTRATMAKEKGLEPLATGIWKNKQINEEKKIQQVEDLYRPYKQKRRTRTTMAKEKGLEPLATRIWQHEQLNVEKEANDFLSEELDLHTIEDVLAGVNDIIAEWVSDDATYREFIREETFKRGIVQSEVKHKDKDEKGVYEMYYEFSEPVRSLVSHRTLALNRGEKED